MFRLVLSIVFAISLSLVSTAHLSAALDSGPAQGSWGVAQVLLDTHSAREGQALQLGQACTLPVLNATGGHLRCHVDIGPVAAFSDICDNQQLPRRSSGPLRVLCVHEIEPPLQPPEPV